MLVLITAELSVLLWVSSVNKNNIYIVIDMNTVPVAYNTLESSSIWIHKRHVRHVVCVYIRSKCCWSLCVDYSSQAMYIFRRTDDNSLVIHIFKVILTINHLIWTESGSGGEAHSKKLIFMPLNFHIIWSFAVVDYFFDNMLKKNFHALSKMIGMHNFTLSFQ